MSERIRMLEEALKAAHRLTAAQPHPLLTDEFMKIKEVHEQSEAATRDPTPGSAGGDDASTGEIVGAFGSLSVSQSGQAKYFGHAANSWVRICAVFKPSHADHLRLLVVHACTPLALFSHPTLA